MSYSDRLVILVCVMAAVSLEFPVNIFVHSLESFSKDWNSSHSQLFPVAVVAIKVSETEIA